MNAEDTIWKTKPFINNVLEVFDQKIELEKSLNIDKFLEIEGRESTAKNLKI